MTVELATAADRIDTGAYRSLSFTREQMRELRYAGLLHDFGKVGVREHVLVKEKKLYPPRLDLIRERYAFIHRSTELDFERRRAEYLEQHGSTGYDDFLQNLRREHDGALGQLNRFLELVVQSNEPSVLPAGNFEELMRFAEVLYTDVHDQSQPYLTNDEVRYLTIKKGSLDEFERKEIEDHVTHTYDFLLRIPWTTELRDIPMIAYGHHEKLDGSGYPRKIAARDIPPQTRMMTISDIFDALTASDRALDIMTHEVKGGMLDPDLFTLFVDAKVFEALTRAG